MTNQIDMVPPVAKIAPAEPTEELTMIQPTANDVDLFQKGFENTAMAMEHNTIAAMHQIDKSQMHMMVSNIQTVSKLLDRDD